MTSRNSQKLEGGERRVHPFPRKDLEDFDSPLPTPPFRPGSSFVVKSFDKWWGWERWGAGSQSVPARGGGGGGRALRPGFHPRSPGRCPVGAEVGSGTCPWRARGLHSHHPIPPSLISVSVSHSAQVPRTF